jgi:hypothetical protein
MALPGDRRRHPTPRTGRHRIRHTNHPPRCPWPREEGHGLWMVHHVADRLDAQTGPPAPPSRPASTSPRPASTNRRLHPANPSRTERDTTPAPHTARTIPAHPELLQPRTESVKPSIDLPLVSLVRSGSSTHNVTANHSILKVPGGRPAEAVPHPTSIARLNAETCHALLLLSPDVTQSPRSGGGLSAPFACWAREGSGR